MPAKYINKWKNCFAISTMQKPNKEYQLSQNLYFECLVRIFNGGADSSHDFLNNVLKEITGLTHCESGYIFIVAKNDDHLDLIISSGEAGHNQETLSDYLTALIKEAGQRTPILINKSDIREKPDSSKDKGDCLICIIRSAVGNKPEAVFVLLKKSGDFDKTEAENIQFLLNLLWKISSVYILVEKTKELKEKADRDRRLTNNFLLDFSHKIRTPVNAIVGFSNLMWESEKDAEMNKKYLSIIIDSSSELLSIWRNFSELSKLEYNLQRTSIYKVNVKEVMREFEDSFSAKARDKKLSLSIKTDLKEKDIIINTDGNKLNQIIFSLMDSAFKFTLSGGIELGCRKIPGFIEFRVVDSGTGYPDNLEDDISNYLSANENILSNKTNETTTGLAIAYAYVKHLNGKIWYTSKEGNGRSFYFTLPFIPAPVEKIRASDASSAENDEKQKRKTILVAEDDNNNYALIERIILNENYSIFRAVNGQEAVDICKSKEIDLVLMDIRMPVMDGYEAARKILSYKPDMKIIAQTAYQDDRDFAIRNGCVDFITKPFNSCQLMLLIKHYIS
jgi:signal transduction histidine kinase/CheY-like chemotaxis protein